MSQARAQRVSPDQVRLRKRERSGLSTYPSIHLTLFTRRSEHVQSRTNNSCGAVHDSRCRQGGPKNSSASARLHCGLTLDRLLLGKGHHLRSSKRSAAIKSAKMVRASTPQLLLHQQQWRLQPASKLFWIVEMRRASAMAVMRSDARWGLVCTTVMASSTR